MVGNQWDFGMQEDFNWMTYELGREVTVYPRNDVLTYGGQEGEASGLGTGVKEIVFLQELRAEHEVVRSGQFDVGDVRFVFRHDSIAEEEGYVKTNDKSYKILTLTKVSGQTNNQIMGVIGFGRKVANR